MLKALGRSIILEIVPKGCSIVERKNVHQPWTDTTINLCESNQTPLTHKTTRYPLCSVKSEANVQHREATLHTAAPFRHLGVAKNMQLLGNFA